MMKLFLLLLVVVWNLCLVFSFSTIDYRPFHGKRVVIDPWTTAIRKGCQSGCINQLFFKPSYFKGPVTDLSFCGMLCNWEGTNCQGIQVKRWDKSCENPKTAHPSSYKNGTFHPMISWVYNNHYAILAIPLVFDQSGGCQVILLDAWVRSPMKIHSKGKARPEVLSQLQHSL